MIGSLLALRNLTAENIVNTYSDATYKIFKKAHAMSCPNIVAIPACNEQVDLPAALLTLSRSNVPVLPIVVDNGSEKDDKTYDYARRMGAVTLRCEPAKMRATQVGLRYARTHFPEQKIIHFGDADNLYPRNCVSAIHKATNRASENNNNRGTLLFGLGAYDHGSSLTVDLMRSGRVIRKAISRKFTHKTPMPYGFNYALHLGKNEQITEAIYALDPLLFVREESEICKAVISAGGTISQLISLGAYVFTRGDLIKTRSEWRDFKGASIQTKTKYYKRNYPNVDFKPNAEGRKNLNNF